MSDSTTPVNLAGMRYFEIEQIDVGEYHPLADGKGQPTQVHLNLQIANFPYPLVMRFKSRRPVDELIVALIAHANNVWGKIPK